MRTDKYGQVIFNSIDAFNALYAGKIKDINTVLFDPSTDIEKFNQSIKDNYDRFCTLNTYKEDPFMGIDMFDEANQCTWFMPEEYQKFPIHQWLLDQCNTEIEKNRVDEELTLFIQHGMFDLLFYLKYLVDTMRENQIVWGVGRGSSVASFVLYLLGVHKINSIKYNLDIREFLK
jgi:DNA polymerase III alpha subunit